MSRKGRPVAEFRDAFDPLVRAQNAQAAAEQRLADLQALVTKDAALAALYAALQQRPAAPPAWLVAKPRRSKRSVVTATAFLSDCHFDEVVNPVEINGVNEYNRAIAEQRLRTFGEKVVLMCTTYLNFDVQGLVLPMGGDMVSGNIHEELKESNEALILETCLHWADRLQACVEMLAKAFPKVHVPCVVGNHGRMTRKPRAKGRVQDNFDWLIYKLLEQRAPKNVTYQVGLDADVRWQVHEHRYQMTHGDQFRGGEGWGGLASPILRGDQRKRVRESVVRTPYDTLIMGHWHRLSDFGKVLVNGSLKGYDEYAALANFEFEVPQQAFWLTAPGYGRVMTCPLFVA